MTVQPFSAMLAGQSNGLPKNTEDYVVEEKLDGMRGLLVMDRTKDPNENHKHIGTSEYVHRIQIWNRYGENKNRLSNTPKLEGEIRALGEAIPDLWNGTVLDGELIAQGDTVAQTWNRTMHLLGSAGQSEEGLRFVVFDLPYLMGNDIRNSSWTERRELLETLFKVVPEDSMMQISSLLPATEEELKKIWARGGEGVIVKRKSAAYYPGDRKNWFKIKAVFEADGVIMDFVAGRGKYSDTFGAVVVGQYKDGKLERVTQMSGMTDEVRRNFNPDTDIGKVIEFTHMGRTVNSYRHPQWSRFRPDKKPEDCTWETS